MKILNTIILCSVLTYNIFSQNIPQDFKLICTAAGSAPWTTSQIINLSGSGQTEFSEFENKSRSLLIDTTFSINISDVQLIWQSVQNNNFFSLDSSYINDSVLDGNIAILSVTANGLTKQVFIKNAQQKEIQNIINTINSVLPAAFILDYSAPQNSSVVTETPCGKPYVLSPSVLKKISSGRFKHKSNIHTTTSLQNVVQIPHGGFEVGYEMPLIQAVADGKAQLKSKGLYFGDAVSITGYNTSGFPPQDSIIHFKLNLEFYGPCDNRDNEFKITKDIVDKWNGRKTTGGKTIEMDVVSLSRSVDTAAPPRTPGFDEIKLACGNHRSWVGNLGKANKNSVTNGTWYVNDLKTPGTFGHEAGHLMGLDDQYDDWKKNDNGTWVNQNTGEVLSTTELVNLYNSRVGTHYTVSDFGNDPIASIPHAGHRNDLMYDESKPPLQWEIDSLAAKAGLIIHINAGDILPNTAEYQQSLVVTHSGDLILLPGQIKTLRGIYAACLDYNLSIPDSGIAFDIAPPLDKWNGIPASGYLLKLVHYIDSAGFYCQNSDFAQHAIWRITNNLDFFDPNTDSLFKHAGINISGKIFHFPALSYYSNNDSTSILYVPGDLFIPDIQPQKVQAGIGEKLTFTASILKPLGFNYPTNYSWILNAPAGSSSQISSGGSFTPDKTGIYRLSLKINITGSGAADTGYTAQSVAYAIVPNNYTETFEHTSLSDKFPWKSYGDVKWKITGKDAQTGLYSATSGKVYNNQTSTLSIKVNLQTDSSVTFALKFLGNGGYLSFDVDSNYAMAWDTTKDWKFFSYNLTAGSHTLTWTLYQFSDIPSAAWLDNVFFPENSVVTEIKNETTSPRKFELYQNYPNPFNPVTKIRYSIPYVGTHRDASVRINVYDILGRDIATLVNKKQQPGIYEVTFDGSNLASGIYFYKITAGNYTDAKKMILMK